MKYNQLLNLIQTLDSDQQTKLIRYFIKKVDGQLFTEFIRKIKKPYFELIFQQNYQVQSSQFEKFGLYDKFGEISILLAGWYQQIEISCDLIQRAQLYNLYNLPRDKQDMSDVIKKNQLSMQSKKLNLNYFTQKLIKQLSQKADGKITQFLKSNSQQNYRNMFQQSQFLINTSTFKWLNKVVNNLSVNIIISQIISQAGIQSIDNIISKQTVLEELETTRTSILQITEKLALFNFRIRKLISLSHWKIQTKEEIQKELDQFLGVKNYNLDIQMMGKEAEVLQDKFQEYLIAFNQKELSDVIQNIQKQ